MPQVIRSPKVYDVCIIGSGAGGGTAAKVLTEGGLNVVMLEAGPLLNPRTDYKEHVWPYALPHRGADIGGRARHELNGEFLAPNGFWEIEGEPYTTAPGSNFRWFRSRIEGGRTNHYGRISLRVSAADLKARSRDGLGDDWPISYEELSPYYDKVEAFIGVFGTKENLADAPDGVFLPPPKPRCTETLVKKACDQLNITCIPSRMAILTKPVNGRAPCHYCAQCGRGCISASNFSSSQVMIPPAQATGRFTLIPNAMAREVVVGKDGKGAGRLLHRQDDAPGNARPCQSVRGGRELLRNCALVAEFTIHALSRWAGEFIRGGRPVSHGFRRQQCNRIFSATGGGGSAQSRRYRRHAHVHAVVEGDRKNDFPRGYHIEFGGGRHMPGVGGFDGICSEHEGYGASLKQNVRSKYGNFIGFSGRGEMIPNPDTYCEIDPVVVDKWGIPVLRFHFAWSDYEFKMAKDMQETFRAIVEAAEELSSRQPAPDPAPRTRNQPQGALPYGISEGGEIIHELGTVRMGDDPKTSVLNKNCQAHDVKNLFVGDGACFVTGPDKNPTLTITALSWRTSEYLLDQARKGEI